MSEQIKVWISPQEKTFSNIKLNDSYQETANEFFDKDIVKEVALDMGYFVYWE